MHTLTTQTAGMKVDIPKTTPQHKNPTQHLRIKERQQRKSKKSHALSAITTGPQIMDLIYNHTYSAVCIHTTTW